MNFLKWLQIDEARWRGPVGGAFGKTKDNMSQNFSNQNPLDRNPPPQERMDNRFQHINQRVEYGKGIEKQIFDSLTTCGMKLRPASDKEDMFDKIDGWWMTKSGEFPIQIKYRDTGDDILFEVMKDYRAGIAGRDMIGKAKFYAVLNRTGKIFIVSVAEAKSIIETMRANAEKDGFDPNGNYRMGAAMLRLRPDPKSGQEKLMAYIPTNMLKPITPACKANVKY